MWSLNIHSLLSIIFCLPCQDQIFSNLLLLCCSVLLFVHQPVIFTFIYIVLTGLNFCLLFRGFLFIFFSNVGYMFCVEFLRNCGLLLVHFLYFCVYINCELNFGISFYSSKYHVKFIAFIFQVFYCISKACLIYFNNKYVE